MKFQWNLILALVFALIVAIFAVVNVEPVQVKYVFGVAEWPLILVILGSALAGGIIVGSVGLFRIFFVQRRLKTSQKENEKRAQQISELEQKVEGLQHELDEKKNDSTIYSSTTEFQTEEDNSKP